MQVAMAKKIVQEAFMLFNSLVREFLFPKLSHFSETVCRVADNEIWKSRQKYEGGEVLTRLGPLQV